MNFHIPMNPSLRAVVVAVALLLDGTLSVGCTDLDIVPENARLSCTSAEDCPSTFVCRESIGECINEDVLNQAPIAFVLDPQLDRTTLSRQPTFSTAGFSVDFSSAPSRSLAVFVGAQEIDCGNGTQLRCTIDAVDLDLDDGVHAVSVVALDAAGNEIRGAAEFLVDNTPPALVAIPFRLLPLDGNPRSQLSALGVNNGLAEVDMVFTETLSEVPEVRLLGTPAIDLIPKNPPADPTTELAYSFTLSVNDVNAEQGLRAIAVTATDTVGNQAELTTSAMVEIDTIAPAAPTTEIPDRIVFKRSPWGSSTTTNFEPVFSIAGEAGSVEENAIIRSRTGPSLSDLLTGEGVADATGAMDFELLPFDVPRVYLSAIDGAGNESDRAAVHDIEWTASLGGKISGSVVENPHQFFTSEDFSPLVLRKSQEAEASSTVPLVLAPGVGSGLTLKNADRFVEAKSTPPENIRVIGAATAFHAGRGTIMVFGGETDTFGNFTNDLYEITGDTWRLVATENRPLRLRGQMVYEPAYDRLLLLMSNFLFAFENGDWRQLPVASPVAVNSLPGIENGKLVFDPALGLTMLSNGTKTAFFDGQQWGEILESPQVPSRVAFGLGFDPQAQKVMLYGGTGLGVGQQIGDRWHFDASLDGGTWIQLADAEPNLDVQLVADTNRNRLYAVGGLECLEDIVGNCTRPIALVQQFDADTGVLATVGDFGIDAIAGSVVFDPVGDRLVWIGGLPRVSIFGGPEGNFVAMNADYSVDDLNVLPIPIRATSGHFGIFDPSASEALFLFGDSAGKAVTSFTDASALDASGGRVLGDTGVEPQFSLRPFFDGETIVFRAGPFDPDVVVRRDGDLWVSQPAGGFPVGAGAAFHPLLDGVYGFGGSDATSAEVTFSYAASVATPVVTATVPPAREHPHLIYDDRRQVLLMFGGRTDAGNLFDTWAFDGTDWTQLSGTAPIEVFDGLTFFFDTERGRPMLVRNQAIFEFTETGWHRARFIVEDQTSAQAYVYDTGTNKLISHGGRLGGTLSTLKTYSHDGQRRPAHLFDVDLRTRRALPTAVIQSAQIRALAGGRGFVHVERGAGQTPAVEVDEGASLHVWTGRFLPLGSNAAAPDATAPLEATIDSTQLLSLVGNQRLRIALTPTQGQGPRGPSAEGAEIATRAIEVIIRYRE